MAKYRICFSVAGEIGGEIIFEASAGVSYKDAAGSIDKDALAEKLSLDCLGYSGKDIEIIAPEEFDAEFGDDDDEMDS